MTDKIHDLIDGATWETGDAMRWTPQPPHRWTDQHGNTHTLHLDETAITVHIQPATDIHGRVPYGQLTDDEREALHHWCTLHDIDHTRVPIDTNIEQDGDEWRIEVHHLRDGKPHLDPHTGDIAYVTLRRTAKADLPWRTP